jgi:hypothetical protein
LTTELMWELDLKRNRIPPDLFRGRFTINLEKYTSS